MAAASQLRIALFQGTPNFERVLAETYPLAVPPSQQLER